MWIALTLPDLPLQAYTRGSDEPGVLAVVEHRPRQRLVAATAAARARGVEPGIGVAGALAVAPDLELRERDTALEEAAIDALANWAGSITPHVSIDPPDAIVLEVGTCLRLFGGLAALVDRLRQGVRTLGLDVRLAAAPTPLAARWLAEARSGTLVRHTPGWWRELDTLPVHVLAVGATVSPATLELLHGIGARTLGDAARLPRDGLARRQAAGVLQALARARGEAPDPRRWHQPPERFASRLVLPAPVAGIEPLLFAARRLIAGLVAWLDSLHAAIDRCCLHLEHDDHPDTVLTVITGQPSRDEERLAMLVREHLAVLTLDAPVEALRLSTDSPVSHPPRSIDLFGDPARAAEDASLLLDRLRARLGREAVRALRPWPDHRPERAWRTTEPASPAETPQRRRRAPTPAAHSGHGAGVAVPADAPAAAPPGAMPSPGPQPATAVSGNGIDEIVPMRPAWLLPAPHALPSVRPFTLLRGPERVESGWWDGGDVRRDYYVARAPGGGLWWLFECLDAPGSWYVHGYFG